MKDNNNPMDKFIVSIVTVSGINRFYYVYGLMFEGC